MLKPLSLAIAACIAGGAAAADGAKSAADVANAAEKAAARARYEQMEREVEAILRARREDIRRESGSRGTTRTKPAAAEAARNTDWAYSGENGPENWSKLRPEWAQCAGGDRQSPIDIRDGIAVELEQIVFDYKPTAYTVVDTGRSIQVNFMPGNRITITGRSFELLQFHFHRPAEERVAGRGFDMAAHLVHKDAQGKLAMIAVLIESGNPNPVLQTVWNNLPLEKNDPVAPVAPMDPSQLLPEKRDYYTYMGSITEPPCSEGVLWMVFKQPVQASMPQIDIFSRLYPMNARPLQPASDRLIKESR